MLNEARPVVNVELRRTAEGLFEFHYSVENAPDARNPIGRFNLALEPDDPHFDLRQHEPEARGWGGVRDITTRPRIAVQVALPGAPNGAYGGWSHWTNFIYPGQKLSGLVLVASYRPGFTTGYIGSGQHWDLDMELPIEIWDQLGFLNLPEWREQHVLTIGPRYPPTTAPSAIASEFLTGIEQWISSRRLEADSPFVAAARSALERWRRNPNESFEVPRNARTAAERELETALRFTLGNSKE
ncbi:MAG TPA: hypothetical protein VNJ11_07465 [Bryobacteraceae bacterium]|nr:hypothetical protein [Bryobacteraceae bacterium]